MFLSGRAGFVWVSCVALVSASCSKGGYRQNQAQLSAMYKQGQYSKAKELVVSDEFLPDKDEVLLKTLEEGMAYLSNGNACIATKIYDKASNIVKEHFTKSATKEVASGTGATDGIYYGQTYEQSLLNFYQSLANYKVYNTGVCEKFVPKKDKNQISTNGTENDNAKQDISNSDLNKIDLKNMVIENQTLDNQAKQVYLGASKASVMYWDSWMKGREIQSNDQLYMDDLLLKLWGAFIHEQVGTSSDLQIAKQLYKDALNVAKVRYAIYKTFNNKNKGFIEHLKESQTRMQYLDDKNTYLKDVVDYVYRQLKRLESKKQTNLAIVIQDGVVAEKIAQKEINPVSIAALALTNNVAVLAGSLLSKGYEFEKPFIQQYDNNYKYYYSLWQGNKKIVEKPVILAEPIADMAYENLQEKISGIVAKTLAKVNAQLVVGLLSAYSSYIALSSVDETLALLSAAGVFAGYSTVIRNAGIVDTRQWVSLPANIFIATDNIKSGKYTLKIMKRKNALNDRVDKGIVVAKQEQLVYKKDIQIDEKGKTTFIDVRL